MASAAGGDGGRPEPAACPACGGPLARWRSAPPAEPGLGDPIALLRCAICHSAVTDADLAPELHETGAYGGGDPRLSRLAAPVLRAFDRRRLSLLRVALGPGPARLLDVGAGRGRFVASARAAGLDARGLEPSERGVRAAAERYGVVLERTSVDGARIEPGTLDAVTLWHVLEHLEDPGAALERIAGWLAPGGVLLVGVPNILSLQAALGGARWFHLDVPRHRTHFSPPGLRALLARHKLEPLAETQLLAEHNLFGMWQSLFNRVTPTPSYLYNLLKRNVALRPGELAVSLAALALAPATSALELAAGAAGRGGSIALTARRAA